MRKIIAIVGMPGSGKGTVTDHLEKKGYPKVYLGGMVYEEVKNRGLTIIDHEKEVREDMRKQQGPAVMAKRASLKADEYFESGKEIVVFDGLYSWSEFKYLEEKYNEGLVVIAVFTPRKLRYKRVVERADKHRPYSEEDIRKRDYEEIENIEKGGPIAIADYTVVNDKGLAELLTQIDAIIDSLK